MAEILMIKEGGFTRRSFFKGSLALAACSVIAVPTIGCNTSWIATATKDLQMLAPVLQSIAQIVLDSTGNAALASTASAVISAGINEAEAGLATLSSLIASYNAAAPNASVISKIDAALTSVQTNLSSILSVGHIADAGLSAAISGGITLALTVISAIELLIPSSAVSVKLSLTGAAKPTPKLLTPEEIKTQYNTILSTHGYNKYMVTR